MKRLPLSAAFALALCAAVAGCGSKEPYGVTAGIYVLRNGTATEVVLEACRDGVAHHSWTIEPGGELRQTVASDEYRSYARDAMSGADLYTHVTVFDFAEARLLFGGERELRFTRSEPRSPHNIFDGRNYTPGVSNDAVTELVYVIDREVMDAAAPIGPDHGSPDAEKGRR